MNRWIWMLALPYIVETSSMTPAIHELSFRMGPDINGEIVSYLPKVTFHCHEAVGVTCDWIFDMAAALNEAHERRMSKTTCQCPNGDFVDCEKSCFEGSK